MGVYFLSDAKDSMNCRLLSVLLCVLFIAPSFQYGILRVEEIWSTEDVLEVKIEEMVITESNIQIDYIEELNDSGVTVEDTIFDDGSITIPGDFTTCCGIEFKSSLEANLGLFADAPNSPEPFSFTIDDNSGDVFILDELRLREVSSCPTDSSLMVPTVIPESKRVSCDPMVVCE